jgi:pyruvate dehydrogenase E2 component (dihydrolipoamide acetyltransferase)
MRRFQIVKYLSTYPSHQVVGMPALSPTMTHGTISSWNKQPGDVVAAGETIAEVETDKASMV